MVQALILMCFAALPEGAAPPALEAAHFPTRLHAYVWRNWSVAPLERMGAAIDAEPEQLAAIGASMGLGTSPVISEDQWRRSYITVIRRNWHLLPYAQLLKLLDWSEEEMAYALREDDFLYVKLGNLKPKCAPLRYEEPDATAAARAASIRAFMEGVEAPGEPLFSFVEALSAPPTGEPPTVNEHEALSPRYCHSYFALYGDTLLRPEPDPYPDGYLARLAASGADGVWLQGVLYKLAPYPWDAGLSAGHETRIENLRKLVARAKRHGLGVWMYLNEPRAMPLSFYEGREELKGVVEGDFAALCTSAAPVHDYIVKSVEHIARAVPDLAGFFTISASENLTNCWSHYQGAHCPRCKERAPAAVIADLHHAIQEGIDGAGSSSRLIAWDWGWQDGWAKEAIRALPAQAAQMSVSEWSIPFTRGGVQSQVGEYSLSVIGPGPRATAHWATAREAGLRPLAKLQVGTTWELGAVPYVPAVANVAEHMRRLREAGVQGVMLGWTLGGYPSPNVEVATMMLRDSRLDGGAAMEAVAARRFGPGAAAGAVRAWESMSAAFQEFPYHNSTVYNAPLQQGPSNLLWGAPTGYASTMVGIPYDALDAWRGAYPVEVFAGQLDKCADGFEEGAQALRGLEGTVELKREADIAEACAIHYRSVAVQSRFVAARNALLSAEDAAAAQPLLAALEGLLDTERALALRLYAIQSRDSRVGYEATNHYFYVPMDLLEKALNCAHLREAWLTAQRGRFVGAGE